MRKFLPLRLASCTLLLGALLGCSGSVPTDPAQLLKAAVRHHEEGKHEAAIIELRNLLAVEPQQVEARRLLAVSYLESGEPRAAEDEIRKAIEYGLDRRQASVYLGRAQLLQGQYERLLEEIVPAQDMTGPQAVEIRVLRGLANLGIGNVEDAKILLERAHAEDAANSDALLGLAAIAAAEGRREQAGQLIERAAAANPNSVDVWLARADFRRFDDKPEQAIEDYERALALKPSNVNAHLQLAALYAARGASDRALEHVEALRKKAPDSLQVHYLTAVVEFHRKNYRLAAEAAERALRKDAAHLPSLLLASTVALSAGEYSKAIQGLQAFLERAPGHAGARRMLAAAMVRNGQVQGGIEMLEEAAERSPNDPQLLTMLAEAHLQNNQIERAIGLLERASKANPGHAATRQRLHIARLLGGQSAEVLADLEAGSKLDKPSATNELLLAVTLIQRRQFERALQAIAALEQKQQSALAYNLKAAALLGQGKPDDARKALETALALDPHFATALLNLARLDLQQQGPRAARRRLENQLQREPNNVTVLLALAEMGPRIGAPEDLVTEWLQRAHTADSRSLRPLLLLAERALRAGAADKALAYAEAAQRIEPEKAEVLALLGDVQSALGRHSTALGIYTKLALENPRSPTILYRLAELQSANNNPAGAGLMLKRVLELAPSFAPALVLLAELELRAGRTDSALQLAHQLRRLDARNPASYVLEGDIRQAKKDPATAAALYADARARGDASARLAIKLHMALKQAGRESEAAAVLGRAAKETADPAMIQAYLGDDHLFAGRYTQAVERYQQVIERQPQNPLVLNNLAWASYKLKDRRALEYAEKAHALRPDHPVILDTFGWLLVEDGQLDRGIGLLERAVTATPDDAQTRFHLAQALVKGGQFRRARLELESLLASRTPFEHAVEARALLAKLR